MASQGSLILRQAIELRERVRGDLEKQQFEADDVNMLAYNDLTQIAANLFPSDTVLNGGMVIMPDAVLQSFGTLMPGGSLPADLASKRLEMRLAQLINRLELLTGESIDMSVQHRPATEVLQEEQSPDIRNILKALEELRFQQTEPPNLDDRDFSFVSELDLRKLLNLDFEESQRAYAAKAYKASSLLCGGIIEGILLHKLRDQAITSAPNYAKAVAKFDKLRDGDINWDRVGLPKLIQAADHLGLLKEGTVKLCEGATDFRDMVHPQAELRRGVRAGKEENELLLAFVKLLYRDLAK